MLTQYQKVKEFMTLFKQEFPDKIGMPSLEVCKLRAKLCLEEVVELITKGLGLECNIRPTQTGWSIEIWEEEREPSIVEILDGLCDLHYVGFLGTAIACGIPEENLNAAFDEVHRSNMSKMWKVGELNQAKTLGYDSEYYGLGLYRVTDKDGKTIKSPSYSPAQLEQFLKPLKQIEIKDTIVKQTCMICGSGEHTTVMCRCNYP